MTHRNRNEHEFRYQEQVLRQILLEKFLQAMREDLSEWLSSLSNHVSITAENFLNDLDDGIILCQHARLIQRYAEEYNVLNVNLKVKIPTKAVFYKERGAYSGSFVARDNVANFIAWCRDLGIPDVVIFETDDLVLQKNEKSVILTLMEVARKAYIFGVQPPEIVRFEKEIDEEMDKEKQEVLLGKPPQKPRDLEQDNNLDTMVRNIVNKCTCYERFPIKKLAEGKYQVGRNNALIFVRVMRNHVMVRVGGGWDTFDHYITKHDPCRTKVMGTIDDNGQAKSSVPPTTKSNTKQKQKPEQTIATSTDTSSMCSSSSDGSEGIDKNCRSNCHCGKRRCNHVNNAASENTKRTADTSTDFTRSIEEIDKKLKLLENRKPNFDKVIKDPSIYDNKSDRWLRSHLNTIKQNEHPAEVLQFISPPDDFVMRRGYTADNIDRRNVRQNKKSTGMMTKSERKQKENIISGSKENHVVQRKLSYSLDQGLDTEESFKTTYYETSSDRDDRRSSQLSPLSSSNLSLESNQSMNSLASDPIRKSCNDISTQTNFIEEINDSKIPRPMKNSNDVANSKIPRPVMKRSKTMDGMPSAALRRKNNINNNNNNNSSNNAKKDNLKVSKGSDATRGDMPAIRREKSDLTGRNSKYKMRGTSMGTPPRRKGKSSVENPVRIRNGPELRV